MYENEEYCTQRILDLLVDDPSMILMIKNKYLNDTLWMFSIEKEPSLFKHIKDPSKEICYFACEVDGNNLKVIRKKFPHVPIDAKMCYLAIKSAPNAIFHVPKALQDEGLKELACDRDPSLMKCFDLRPAYIERKIKEHPTYIQFVDNPSDELKLLAMKGDINVCSHFDSFSPRIKEEIRDSNPEIYSMLFPED